MMHMMEVRRIIVPENQKEHSPDCMREQCYEKAVYVLIVKDGPKKDCMYLVCEDCLQEMKNKHPMIPISIN